MPCANRATNAATSYVRCPVLTNHFGKSTARVLQQLHYWLSCENLSYGVIHDNRQWIRNSYNQWHQQIKKTNQDLAIITIRRAFSDLEKQGVVLSHCFNDHKNYMGGNQVKSYTIDYDRLQLIIGDLNKSLISRPRSVQEQQLTSTVQTHNRVGDSPSLSIVSVHTNVYDVCQKGASNPDQMSTPPDQMSTPLNRYISKKHSKKHSHFKAPHGIKHPQQHFGEVDITQPDKPVKRNEIDFSKEMISFWNEIVEENNPERKISLNPKRAQQLNAVFNKFFESDISKWELFCHKITTCKFLMGEINHFKAPIDWTIKFETIQKILEGGYTFGTRVSNYTLKLNATVLRSEESTLKTSSTGFTSSIKESPKAVAIRESIRRKVDNAEYMSWFLPTEIIVEKNNEGNDEATLCVTTRFMGERIKCQYGAIYERYFKEIFVGSGEQYLKSRNSYATANNSHISEVLNNNVKNERKGHEECEPEKDLYVHLNAHELTQQGALLTSTVKADSHVDLVSDENSDKSVNFAQNASPKVDIKPYSSVLCNLKIIQIQKKIKSLVPENLYVKWFKDASLVIEEGRVVIQVSAHSIKQDMQIQLNAFQSELFDEIRVVDNVLQSKASDTYSHEVPTEIGGKINHEECMVLHNLIDGGSYFNEPTQCVVSERANFNTIVDKQKDYASEIKCYVKTLKPPIHSEIKNNNKQAEAKVAIARVKNPLIVESLFDIDHYTKVHSEIQLKTSLNVRLTYHDGYSKYSGLELAEELSFYRIRDGTDPLSVIPLCEATYAFFPRMSSDE